MKRQCNNRLLIEVYKFEIGYSPEIMNDVFHLRHTYNLSNIYALATSVPRNNYPLNSVVYRANQLWETLTFDLKNSCLLELYKKGFKNWRCSFLQLLRTFNSLHQYSSHQILLAFLL